MWSGKVWYTEGGQVSVGIHMNVNDFWYVWCGWIIGGLVFLVVWVAAIVLLGWFMGLIAGWIPAAILGFISGILWPVTLFLLILIILLAIF